MKNLKITWEKQGHNRLIAIPADGSLLVVEKKNVGRWGWKVIYGNESKSYIELEPSPEKAQRKAEKMFEVKHLTTKFVDRIS